MSIQRSQLNSTQPSVGPPKVTPASAPQLTQIVQAGAGAGKTYGLVQQVTDVALWWRQKYGRWPRMVVTTFTRMATQELRERLLIKALELRANNLVQSQNITPAAKSKSQNLGADDLLDFISIITTAVPP